MDTFVHVDGVQVQRRTRGSSAWKALDADPNWGRVAPPDQTGETGTSDDPKPKRTRKPKG